MQGFLLTGLEEYAREHLGSDAARWVFGENGDDTSPRPGPWEYVLFHDFSIALERLAAETGVSRANLLKGYGQVLFSTMAHLPLRVAGGDDLFHCLQTIETGVYEELEELVPHLEYPRLQCRRLSAETLELIYCSPLRLGDLAEGLIRGCIAYFQERVHLRRIDDPGDSGRVTFVLTRD